MVENPQKCFHVLARIDSKCTILRNAELYKLQFLKSHSTLNWTMFYKNTLLYRKCIFMLETRESSALSYTNWTSLSVLSKYKKIHHKTKLSYPVPFLFPSHLREKKKTEEFVMLVLPSRYLCPSVIVQWSFFLPFRPRNYSWKRRERKRTRQQFGVIRELKQRS